MSSKQSLIHVNEVDLNVVERGTGSPSLVFLHYYGGTVRTWSSVIDDLSTTNRCVAIDFRGWGWSEKGSALDYDLDQLAADVLGVVEHLQLDPFIIVAHSMGGKVAQILAAQQPVGLQGLILLAPAPPAPLDSPPEFREMAIGNYTSREGAQRAIGLLAALPLTEAQQEQVIEDTLSSSYAAKRAWLEAGMIKDITGRTTKVTAPIRVLVGERDHVMPEEKLRPRFDPYYPQAEYVVIPGTGHLSPLEATPAVIDAIRTAPFL